MKYQFNTTSTNKIHSVEKIIYYFKYNTNLQF